ncbi:MAG TPA: FUSC family protein, partial [Acidimicrobiales bacterium]|nr:FUSC family protein [Acidimicrobiales bacterium]
TAADDLTGPGGRLRGALRRRRVLLHRFATSVSLLGDSLRDWELVGGDVGGKGDIFSPAVGLAGGWLPGSRDVSNRASRAPGARWDERLPLPPYVRSAVQLAVSIGGATAAGDALDPTRFYWAVIAAFVTFTGVNTSAEQLRKAAQRVVGTVVGILLGSLVARVTGTHIAADVVAIMVFLFLGLYLFRLSYTAFVVGVTIILSELYRQLHELSGSFLLMRLAETAVGSAVAAVTVFVVLPLRTRRVLDLARRDLLGATRDLVVEAGDRLASEEQRAVVLAEEARVVDSAYQSLAMTAAPLRRLGEVGRRTQRMMVAAGALRHYCDNLAVDVPPAELPPGVDVVRAEQVLLASLDGMLVDGPVRPYVRSASEWSAVEQQALDALRRAAASGAGTAGDVVAVIMSARDLQLLDGALAELARLQGAEVRSLDTEALDEDVGATRDGP